MIKEKWHPLLFRPNFKQYVWGGRNLPEYHKESQEGSFSESWEISCHPNGENIISNGCWEETPLSELIKKYPMEMLGKSHVYKDNFPLLIKLINTKIAPSVQVHPNDGDAKRLENYPYGKSEMWYILSCDDHQECYIRIMIS